MNRLADLGHFVVALAALAFFSAALRIAPYRRLARWLPRAGTRPAEGWRTRRLHRHVTRAARWTPGASCLPQAMTGYLLLAGRGREALIRIGVKHPPGEAFRAHATLVSGGRVLLGGEGDADTFHPLTDLQPGR